MNPNYQESHDFLSRWAPDGPWILTAIKLGPVKDEKKKTCTRTFRPSKDEPNPLLNWLTQYGKDHNVYFHVNPALRDLNKKAMQADIAKMAWLHVDIDPRAGENIHEERERALRLLQEPPGNLPKPTVVVFSGGGYQGFWRLREPFPINGQTEAYEEAKRYNIQLEIIFGADHCRNVDRIMRLPGTINRPNAKKRAKGRVEKLAQLVSWEPDRIYDLSQFTPAPQVQSSGSSARANAVEISGNIERLADVDDPRLDKVADLAKVVIVNGRDPESPDKFPSRSEALFYVCCEMVRAECTNDTIFAIITDPDFLISESVLEKGSDTERYALHQIRRARDRAIAPELQEMNDRHAVIGNWGGKCRVIEEVPDPVLGRSKITRQSFEDLRNRYMNRLVKVTVRDKDGNPKDAFVPLGKWWLNHKNRKQFNTLIFAPGKEIPGAYNLWKGFACDAKPGDCDLFLDHINKIICQENPEHYSYTIGWLANTVQHPGRPGYSAVVLRGAQGTGKSFFAKTIGSLFGRHFLHMSDPKHLVGSFNAHLRDCVVLFGDEAFYAGDQKHESVLKMLITEDMRMNEAKGMDAEMATNCIHLIMASNSEWVVPADMDDRRFFVLDTTTTRREDTVYFRKIQEQMDSGGREALLHFLMTYDLSGFDVRKVPKTKALQDQKIFSMNPIEEWWYQKLRSGVVMEEDAEWAALVLRSALQQDFIAYARDYGLTRRGSASRLGKMMVRFLPAGYPVTVQKCTPVEFRLANGNTKVIQRPYFYQLPSLEECRAHWDEHFGGPYTWPEMLPPDKNTKVPF